MSFRETKKAAKDIITSFFKTGINACLQILCTFNEKSSNFFRGFFVLRGSNYVTVPCILLRHSVYKYTYKILQDIRVLKINTYTWKQWVIQTQSRMMQCMNQWFLSLQKGIKTIKYWNYKPDEYGIDLVKWLFECI